MLRSYPFFNGKFLYSAIPTPSLQNLHHAEGGRIRKEEELLLSNFHLLTLRVSTVLK
jgi:hypothetical protein